MHIARRFTTAGRDPYETVAFRSASSEIRNPDGSVVFAAEGIEVPAEWSQVACDILAQKYLRKAGVPARLAAIEEEGVPSWLWRRTADETGLALLPKAEHSCGETSARQVFDRMAGTWTYWGWKGGYFDGEEDARAFYDELRLMLARQMGAPNSPQWFNTGLYWAYGIDGPAQGHYYVDYRTGKLRASESAYEHPQPHACFIQSVADDLVNEGGIMDLWVREARLFKYGSGTGSNFSKLRGDGERLSGGGRSSGLMSFLKIGDRAAGAIKSGGTTRRAAKMVIVDADHPDIEAYIDWKVIEEQKVAALVAGSKLASRHLNQIMAACREMPEGDGDDRRFDERRRDALLVDQPPDVGVVGHQNALEAPFVLEHFAQQPMIGGAGQAIHRLVTGHEGHAAGLHGTLERRQDLVGCRLDGGRDESVDLGGRRCAHRESEDRHSCHQKLAHDVSSLNLVRVLLTGRWLRPTERSAP